MKIFLVGEFQAIGEQAADLSVLLGMGDQGGQVITQGRFAACECDVRDSSTPGFIEDRLPFLGGQFAVHAFGGCVFGFVTAGI